MTSVLQPEKWRGYAPVAYSKRVDDRSPTASRVLKKNVNISFVKRSRIYLYDRLRITCFSRLYTWTYSILRNIFFVRLIDFHLFIGHVRCILTQRKNSEKFSIHDVRFLFSTVADSLDHATGLEKREMLARLAGNDVSCDVSTSSKEISLSP